MSKCHIYLPSNIRLHYVASVLGRLLHCKAKVNVETCIVKGVYLKVNNRWPEQVDIVIRPKPKTVYTFCLNYEPDDYAAYRLISVLSNPFHLAVGDRLVKFFGGMVFYDATKVRYNIADLHVLTKEDSENRPTLTGDFDRLHQRIFRIDPLTAEEIKPFKRFALERNLGARLSP